MEYESIGMVATYVQWFIGIVAGILTLRIIYIIHSMSTSMEEGISIGAIFTKVGKYIKAAIIAVVIETIIELFKSYYIH